MRPHEVQWARSSGHDREGGSSRRAGLRNGPNQMADMDVRDMCRSAIKSSTNTFRPASLQAIT